VAEEVVAVADAEVTAVRDEARLDEGCDDDGADAASFRLITGLSSFKTGSLKVCFPSLPDVASLLTALVRSPNAARDLTPTAEALVAVVEGALLDLVRLMTGLGILVVARLEGAKSEADLLAGLAVVDETFLRVAVVLDDRVVRKAGGAFSSTLRPRARVWVVSAITRQVYPAKEGRLIVRVRR
jgi:hypothetical protein